MTSSGSEEELSYDNGARGAAAVNALPAKSRYKYDGAYNIFLNWKEENKANNSENSLMGYFDEYMKKYKPSTVWAHYSMLKTMLKFKENHDIGKYYNLTASLKKNASGFQSKKSEVFTGEQIRKFLEEAPDDVHLANKISTPSEVDGIDLFNPNLLERVANQLRGDGLIFRPLNSRDYDKGFLQLLGQLTEVGNVTKDQFLNRFHGMKSSGGYYVIIVEDLNCGKVIGSATLVVEQKFIHSCGLRGHLEDVVVNSEYRGKQLGKLVVMAVKQLAKGLQCYKLTLECRDRLIPFYERLGFKREPGNANSMNARFPHENPAEQSRL